MRNLLLDAPASHPPGAVACTGGPGSHKEPPVLKVTSPAAQPDPERRHGAVTVTGTVTPNATGDAGREGARQRRPGDVGADGASRIVQFKPGATLIQTERATPTAARRRTRARFTPASSATRGSNIDRAVTASISAESFAKISAAAGHDDQGHRHQARCSRRCSRWCTPATRRRGLPVRPRLRSTTSSSQRRALARRRSRAGSPFSAEIDGLDVPGHANYAVACADGEHQLPRQGATISSPARCSSPRTAHGGLHDDARRPERHDRQASTSRPPASPARHRHDRPRHRDPGHRRQGRRDARWSPTMNAGARRPRRPQDDRRHGQADDDGGRAERHRVRPGERPRRLDMKMMIAGAENAEASSSPTTARPTLDPGNGFADRPRG